MTNAKVLVISTRQEAKPQKDTLTDSGHLQSFGTRADLHGHFDCRDTAGLGTVGLARKT